MKRIFIESQGFSKRVDEFGGLSLLRAIQTDILKNPESGDIVAGLGGVRKMRMPDSRRGKGKRGGLRVMYLDLSDRNKTYLLLIYGKDESEDIAPEERKAIRNLVAYLKLEN